MPGSEGNQAQEAFIRKLIAFTLMMGPGFAALLALGGCGLVALPFRVVGDVVQVVPVVGGVVGKPIHAVGDAID